MHRFKAPGPRSAAAVAIVALGLAGAAPAEGPSLAIRAGRVLPVSPDHPWVIEDGVIIVRDGKVEAIGSGLEIPRGMRVVHLPDATVMPGIVAASSNLAGAHTGDHSVGAGYHAVDAFDVYGDYRTALATGVTTVHLDPGWHRILSGQGAVVKLGGPPAARILSDKADLTINLGSAVWSAPDVVQYLVPPSPDNLLLPSTPQRPGSRLSQSLALKEAIAAASSNPADWHARALAEAWSARRPLRVQAQEAADVTSAISFMRSTDRPGYIVGGIDAAKIAGAIADSGMPLVYTIRAPFRQASRNLGNDPEATDGDVRDLAKLGDVEFALAMSPELPTTDLRLAAAVARRSSVPVERLVRAITSVPARILGVGDRVGSLAPGRDADLLVLTGDPLEVSTQVQRVYVAGELAYTAPTGNALVVRAGTIWLGPNEWLEDGAILIEGGRIAEVGHRVAHPPGAQVIDAGPTAFVAPGFIDGLGHLGLGGATGATGPETTFARLVGAADVSEHRVALAGVTTVMTAPYRFGNAGSQVSAIKTAGGTRSGRVVDATAAVAFDVRGVDPRDIQARLKPRLDAGRQYLEKWKKYEEELAKWEQARLEGKPIETAPKVVEEPETKTEADPISGTWEITLTAEQFPEPVTAKLGLRLTGSTFEGRVTEPEAPVEHKIVGELQGSQISGTIEVDTGGMPTPTFEGTIDAPDHATGKIRVGGFLEADFVMTRTDKGPIEFRVASKRRRTHGKDGRPLPPKVDPALEPLRALLEKRIPAAIAASTAKEIEAVLAYMIDEEELPILLIGAEEASRHADRLREKAVGVVLPTNPLRRDDDAWYHEGADLSRRGVSIAFQSDAEDGARGLPLVGLYSVERGLSPEAALAALTIDAARMYKVDDRIGAIARGLDGDLVILSGHPFDAATSVERVIVNGEEVNR